MSTYKKVSIGIPVYNEINFINNTLHSAVQQGAEQIVISDNASSDGTSEICQEYAAKYENITYHRFDSVQPVKSNFYKCLNLAKNDYYMMMGGHDLLSKNYVSALREILDTTDSVGAYTNAVHLSHEYAFKRLYSYTYSDLLKSDDAKKRLLTIIEHLGNCSMYYGLYKKEIFTQSFKACEQYKYNGFDHAVLSKIATQGKMTLCPHATFFRIDPPRQETSNLKKWTRVLKSVYGSKYSARKHIPELVPLGIAYTQFLMAQDIVSNSPKDKEYLITVLYCLMKRWSINDKAFKLLLKEFSGMIKDLGISISLSR